MGRLGRRLKSQLRETIVDSIPGAGFLGPDYKRGYEATAPQGWTEVKATVSSAERGKVVTHIGASGSPDANMEVRDFVVRYSVPDLDRDLVDDRDLVSTDWPEEGDEVTLAYDPAKPEDFVLIGEKPPIP